MQIDPIQAVQQIQNCSGQQSGRVGATKLRKAMCFSFFSRVGSTEEVPNECDNSSSHTDAAYHVEINKSGHESESF